MPSKTLNNTTMHFEESGTGRALVLLHGFPLDSRIWEPQRQGLSDRHRVITPDLRGFGKSGLAIRPFSLEDLADDIHALLAELGALPAALGGLSMGGYVALAYVKKYPTDLSALLLLDTKAEGDTPDGKQARDKMIELARTKGAKAVADQMMPKMLSPDTLEHRPNVVKSLREVMDSQPPQTIAAALAAMRDRPDHSGNLPSISVPTLIIVGESDAITPPPVAESMHKAIPRSQLVIIKGAGHMTPMEQPQQVIDALRRFLQGIG
jgi:3-oxoadipate enol-lactonase